MSFRERYFKPVTHSTSALRGVNDAHFSWEQAVAQGKPPAEVASKKAALEAAKAEYVKSRKG